MVIVNLITASGTTAIAAQGDKTMPVSTAVVKQTLNEVSSASLKFPASNKLVHGVNGTNRPAIEIIDDASRVFYGAVVSVEVDIWGNTTLECDGALSFLSDVVKAPFTVNNKTHAEYIEAIITQYNAAMDSAGTPERKVDFGGVVGFSGNVDINHSDEYVDTLSLFAECVEKYGGYMVENFGGGSARPSVGWMLNPIADGGKVIEFGVNELSLTNQLDFSDYASRVYAIGNGATIPNGYVVNNDAEAAWGRRDYAIKSQADNQTALAAEANAVLAERCVPLKSIEITALDLERLGEQYSGFVLGTTARLIDRGLGVDQVIMVNSVERDLLQPYNSKIVLGRSPATLTGAMGGGYSSSGSGGYASAPVTVWEVQDVSQGLIALNSNITANLAWQLTGLDLTPYKRIKIYAKAGRKTGIGAADTSIVPAAIIEMSLDDRAKETVSQNVFIGSAVVQNPNDANRLGMLTCAVSADKTKFAVTRATSLYGTAATSNTDTYQYVFKIEGYYD
jgi:hypothetical protein